MTFRKFLVIAALCVLPISELRGGLPYALASGVHPVVAAAVSVLFNLLAIPLVFVFLNTIHRWMAPWPPYARLFDRVVARARRKVQPRVETYGRWGLVFFVGIPLPVTGAYTGSLGAWVLGLSFRRAFLPITAGVVLAAIIVTTVYYLVTVGGMEALRIFIKA